jgi:DNA polymerase V
MPSKKPRHTPSRTKKQTPKPTSIPPLYVSAAAAGFPAPGDDAVEQTLSLDQHLVQNPTATFFVRVSGHSMEGANITTGDILVVDRSVSPGSGSIVVAAVFGELVVKRLMRKGSKTLLVSEHRDYEPIVISDGSDCTVWGVVVGVVRKLI